MVAPQPPRAPVTSGTRDGGDAATTATISTSGSSTARRAGSILSVGPAFPDHRNGLESTGDSPPTNRSATLPSPTEKATVTATATVVKGADVAVTETKVMASGAGAARVPSSSSVLPKGETRDGDGGGGGGGGRPASMSAVVILPASTPKKAGDTGTPADDYVVGRRATEGVAVPGLIAVADGSASHSTSGAGSSRGPPTDRGAGSASAPVATGSAGTQGSGTGDAGGRGGATDTTPSGGGEVGDPALRSKACTIL